MGSFESHAASRSRLSSALFSPVVTPPPKAGGGGTSAYVQLEPPDRSTALGAIIAPLVVIDGGGETLSKIDKAALEASISVRTWPESTIVPTKKTTTMDIASANRLTVSVQPTEALGDRWYALHLDKLPAGVGLPVRPGFVSKDGGSTHFTRFRRDSAPTVANVTVCGKGGSTYSVFAQLSERAKPEGSFVFVSMIPGVFEEVQLVIPTAAARNAPNGTMRV